MSTTDKMAQALEPFVLANSSEEYVTLIVRSSDITKARQALAAHEADKAPASEDERVAFEVEASILGYQLETYGDGDYISFSTHKCWRMWQARAGRASAQAVPDGMVLVPVEFVGTARRIVQVYAARNPKWPMWENGEPEPKIQDPYGAHAWLEQATAIEASMKEPQQ